jgi:hypothetical protein
MVFALVGFICLATVNLNTNSGAGYFFTYLIEIGTFTSGALVPSWASSDFPNNTTRATALGMIYAFTNLGGIISSETFRTQDAPVYKLGLTVTGCFQAAFIVLGLVMRQYYAWRNKQLDEGKVKYVEGMEQNTQFRYAI